MKICRNKELPVKEANFDQLLSNILHSHIGLGNQPNALPTTSYSGANKGSNDRGLASPRRPLDHCDTGSIGVEKHIMYTSMLRVIELGSSGLRDLIRGLKGLRPSKCIHRAPDVLLERALKEINLTLQCPEDMQRLLTLSCSVVVCTNSDNGYNGLALQADPVSFEDGITSLSLVISFPDDGIRGSMHVLNSDADVLHRGESMMAPHPANALTRDLCILVWNLSDRTFALSRLATRALNSLTELSGRCDASR